MSGYPRRPGATPLSRVRSLAIPDAPAFYERRSCLPQLDCERPHGRDLDSPFFGIRPAFMCYVPSPVLASVGDTDDKFEDLEEANPFSFKEFLKTKNLGLSKEDPASRIYAKEASRHSLGLDHNSPPSQTGGYGLEYQQPFFEDPTGAGDLLDEEEDEDTGWSGAYLPSAIEQTHPERVRAGTSPCSTYLSFFSTPSELAGPESLPPWALSDTDSRVSPASPAGSPSADFAAHGESLGDRHLRTLQISYEALKDENSKLRRKLNEVQSFSEAQTEMVRTLERKLEAKMIKEESDYHDLESVVQQVEQNLELMTKRAVKAENHVVKLKQEISLLQAQVSNFQRENEALRCGQGASLTVVKQNADVALQNLRVVMNGAQASIKAPLLPSSCCRPSWYPCLLSGNWFPELRH
ncbi:endosome-associated-trafficking regulator 1 isoform X2 [Macaca fascicularis]|uniref:endosome-associated-trafficking regulator 1 isoform X2 n=1 Tax=Macaca fascicularis TaxID=9541 RepID=UPI001E25915F|nr:endosome-associated-trafficking regulator 1 isoform X2 [Macaca fascicularis]